MFLHFQVEDIHLDSLLSANAKWQFFVYDFFRRHRSLWRLESWLFVFHHLYCRFWWVLQLFQLLLVIILAGLLLLVNISDHVNTRREA